MQEYPNIPLSREDDDFDILELSVLQKLEKGNVQDNIAGGAIRPFWHDYERYGLPEIRTSWREPAG